MSYSITLSFWAEPTEALVTDWCSSIKARPSAITINGRLVTIKLPHTQQGEEDLGRISNGAVLAFAKAHRLRTATDECGEIIIPGNKKTASHLFFFGNWPGEPDARTCGVMFMPDPHGRWKESEMAARRKAWNNRRQALEQAGCLVVCDADGEGYARFDSLDRKQVQTAMKVAGVRPKKQLSAESLATLSTRLKIVRHSHNRTRSEKPNTNQIEAGDSQRPPA